MNKDISLPIADIHGRHLPLSETTYNNVWDSFDERPVFNESKCTNCRICLAEQHCPTFAFTNQKGNKHLDLEKCFGCGMCAYSCSDNAFEMNTGSVIVDIDENTQDIPIACRQSDIKRAKSLTTKLKSMIEKKEFEL